MIPMAIVYGSATGQQTWDGKGKSGNCISVLSECKLNKQKEECKGVQGKMAMPAGSRYIVLLKGKMSLFNSY